MSNQTPTHLPFLSEALSSKYTPYCSMWLELEIVTNIAFNYRHGLNNVALALMQEMLRNGHNFNDMLLSPYLTDSILKQVKKVGDGVADQSDENKDVATKLLTAIKDADEELESLDMERQRDTTAAVVEQDPNVAKLESTDTEVAQSSLDKDLADLEDTLAGKNTSEQQQQTEESGLISTDVEGIVHLKNTLKSLYKNELEGYNLQMRLEQDTYDTALARYRELNRKRGDPLLTANVGKLKKLSASWLPQLESLIEEEQERCRKAEEDSSDRVRAQYGRFLLHLEPPKLAIITILEVLRLGAVGQKSATRKSTTHKFDGIKTAIVVNAISSAVHNEIRFERLKTRSNRHITGRDMSVAKLATSGKLFNMALRRMKARELRDSTNQSWLDSWDIMTKTRIGSILLSLLLECARVPEKHTDPDTGMLTEHMAPAFTHSCEMYKGRKYGIIAHHSVLKELFKSDSATTLNARHLPMLVPPRPWLLYNSGGYLTQDEPCMRIKENNEQLRYLKKASNEDRLYTLMAGLDSLGMTRWAINRRVFEAVRKVWNSGIELAAIPAHSYDVPEPARPEDYDTDNRSKLKYHMELREWNNNRANQHSERCDCNYKVEIAQAFLNHTMYFPHNMDFRGRAYPIPPHFNHLGNDLCRGLLNFHEGRPLKERGLYWLKIHLANLFGKDKLSHAERIAFVEENETSIMESADNPVPGSLIENTKHKVSNAERPWWLAADDPWQALAACIEYTSAIRSPNPEEYVSHLHIHQDGTCNGLQHYAAMGRDRKGAMEVNLIPSNRPQDVYSGILNVVARLIDEDAKEGVEEALILQNKLTRKIVKQTVMTNVYGVTLIGAKEQIAARLREVKDEYGKHVFDILKVPQLALYVARKIFASIGEMFTQAQQIQNWLNESARRIAKSMPIPALEAWKRMAMDSKLSREKLQEALREAKDNDQILDNETILEIRPDLGPGALRRKRLNVLATKPMTTVVWTTPLGLTVVQPYRQLTKRNVKTNLQHITVNDTNMPAPVNSQKQKTAFPPNFVHSLDASHMTLSAIACKKAGLVFASVHDSYWTHASDIDEMNEILRDQFVKLHQRPIMDNLKEEFERRYANHKMPVIYYEYSSAHSFAKGGMVKAKKRRMAKKDEKAEQEKAVERELAKHHLATHGETEATITKESQSSVGNEQKLTEKELSVEEENKRREEVARELEKVMVTVDLGSIDIIDPKEDIEDALHQLDLINYTMSVNAKAHASELGALRRRYTQKIKSVRSKSNAGKSKAKKKAAEKDEGENKNEEQSPKVDVKTQVKELEEERNRLTLELDAKYHMNFKVPTINLSPTQAPKLYAAAKQLHSDGKLAGSLLLRSEWVPIEFDPLPNQGGFDIKEVLKSPYFFS